MSLNDVILGENKTKEDSSCLDYEMRINSKEVVFNN
jgi:hypothetical protein